MLPINTRGMWIGTFHGLCNRLLRAITARPGCRRPSRFSIGRPAGDGQAPAQEPNVDDEKFPPRELCHFINAHKEQGIPRRAGRGLTTATRRSGSRSTPNTRRNASARGVDFAELLLRCHELLQRNEPLRRITSNASATSWSMSSRTPTCCSTPG